jgi:hypothetical protein
MNAHASPPATAAMDQARRYLAKVIAWPENGEAYVNLHWSEVKQGIDRPIWSGRACRTLEEVTRALTSISSQPGKREIYVCLSSQQKAQEKTSKRGNKYLASIRGQQSVVALKSIFLDIDVKGIDKNSYANLVEAVEALAKFIKDSCMPKPNVIVRSGGGLHVYWTMTRALKRDEWRPLANALAEATKKLGLKCNTQCTIDSARVLRVPDTLNYKTDPPHPVTLVGKIPDFDYDPERLGQALEPYKVALPAAQAPEPILNPLLFSSRPPIASISELSAGIEKCEYAPVHLDDLAQECGFIRETITTGGNTNDNSLWNLTNLIATFTDNPRADAHRMGTSIPPTPRKILTSSSTAKFVSEKRKASASPIATASSLHADMIFGNDRKATAVLRMEEFSLQSRRWHCVGGFVCRP